MKFISIRELRNRPGEVWKQLREDDLVLTANGRPRGVLVGLEDDELEQTLESLRRARALTGRPAQAATGTVRATPEGARQVACADEWLELRALRLEGERRPPEDALSDGVRLR